MRNRVLTKLHQFFLYATRVEHFWHLCSASLYLGIMQGIQHKSQQTPEKQKPNKKQQNTIVHIAEVAYVVTSVKP